MRSRPNLQPTGTTSTQPIDKKEYRRAIGFRTRSTSRKNYKNIVRMQFQQFKRESRKPTCKLSLERFDESFIQLIDSGQKFNRIERVCTAKSEKEHRIREGEYNFERNGF